MKRTVVALILTALAFPAIAAQYAKPDAVLTLKLGNGNAEFNINASAKDGSGIWNDSSSNCVAVLSEMNNGKTSVMTHGCEGYCGASAAGAMDGHYSKK